MTDTCQTCGQRVLIRHGAKLSPRSADIFDMIEKSGKRGIPIETLSWVFYSDKSKRAAAKLVAVHVNRLNDLLGATDVEIRMIEGGYQVLERKECNL